MLAYAFKVLNEVNYRKLETEEFDNILELLSEILILGVQKQIKQGLVKDYIENCTYDEFSLNCYLNRILKSTMNLLLKSDISKSQKKKLKTILIYFTEVKLSDVKKINWKIRFDRNNQTYKMLLNICYLIIHGLLHTESSGETKLMDFDDNQLNSLYERFILKYYQREHPEIKAYSPQIPWQIEEGGDALLPKMQTDVTLEYEENVLIIDAKFYTRNTSQNFGKDIHHSGNLYQIFTYVKNKEKELQGKPHEVSGMLLYARTNESIQPDSDYMMSGNKISVKTLDLNQEFSEIKEQLDDIVEYYLMN